LVIKSI
jgi:hypothetical protein